MTTLTEFLLARIAEDEAGHPGVALTRRDLAECEAKRRILGDHELIRSAYPGTTIETDPCCEVCSAGGEYPGEGFPCRTILFLALPYADHPDYRPEWGAPE